AAVFGSVVAGKKDRRLLQQPELQRKPGNCPPPTKAGAASGRVCARRRMGSVAQKQVTSERCQVMSGPSTLNVQLSTRPQFPSRIVDVIVAGIFIYSGAIKALDPVQSASDID